MVEGKVFSTKSKHQNHATQWQKCVYCAQSPKKLRLLPESKLVLFGGQTLTLRKMVGRKAFLAKPKHQNLVSKWEEYIYSAQSWKEWRLSQKSMFVPFYGWTWILRNMVEIKAFVAEPNHQNCLS